LLSGLYLDPARAIDPAAGSRPTAAVQPEVSKNCMFELTRIAQDPGFAARIFPIVMADAGIFDAVERVGHVRYWENKRDELDEVMRSVGQENLHGIREELDLYEAIRNTIAGILDVLGDMNTLTEQNHRANGFGHLYRSLEAALDPQKIYRS
jgi:internalin A